MSIKSGYHLLVANYKQNLHLSHFQLYSLAMGILTAYFVIGMIFYLVVAFALNKWDSLPEDNFGQPLDDSNRQEMRNFVESLSELKGPQLEADQELALNNIFKNMHLKKAGEQHI